MVNLYEALLETTLQSAHYLHYYALDPLCRNVIRTGDSHHPKHHEAWGHCLQAGLSFFVHVTHGLTKTRRWCMHTKKTNPTWVSWHRSPVLYFLRRPTGRNLRQRSLYHREHLHNRCDSAVPVDSRQKGVFRIPQPQLELASGPPHLSSTPFANIVSSNFL